MKNSSYIFFLVGLIICLVPYPFWFFLGENSFIVVHDNLDSEFVYIIKMLKNGELFNINNDLPGIMNGLPRFLLRTPINITFIIFSFFPPVYAYIVNHLIVHIIGYFGMYILLKSYFIKNNNWLVMSISFCFGFLSYYHIQYGISISGQPILLYAFLNLLKNKYKWYDFLILVIFPFYSFIVVTLPFFLPFLAIIGLVHYKKSKEIPKIFLLGIFGLIVLNIIVEFPIIYSTFVDNEFISHRSEWDKYQDGIPTLNQVYTRIINILGSTQYHTGILNPIPILVALLTILFKVPKKLHPIILSIALIIMWVSFNSIIIYPLYCKISFLKTFNSERFYFLLPFLWLLLLGLVLNELDYKKLLSKVFATIILLFCILGIYDGNTEFKKNYSILIDDKKASPTFEQYFDAELFKHIKDHIGKEDIIKYNFACIGMHPSILQYNDLNTLGSYQNNYELGYKNKFRKIISKELEKDEELQKYFDSWGSRCYVFSAEIGKKYFFRKRTNQKINKLDINTKQIKLMNGKYLLSSIPIVNFKDIDLKFISSFDLNDSFRKLYLYEII